MAAPNRMVAAAVVSGLLLALLPGLQADSDYCSLCWDHTMCIYKGYGAACNKVLASGTTEDDARSIVDAHNWLRNQVAAGAEWRGSPGPQPPAADMLALVWDDELATVAQRWADQCTFSHDACRKVQRFNVGQNLYMFSTTGAISKPNWQAAIQAWYDEVKDFSKYNVDNFQFDPKTGHYSQVAWGGTRYVGCGYTAYAGRDGWNHQMFVCNYGPAGNVIGGRVYTQGDSCSRCPRGCHQTYTSLCA